MGLYNANRYIYTVEGYSVAESKSSLEGEGKGEFKVRNDWETYGQ